MARLSGKSGHVEVVNIIPIPGPDNPERIYLELQPDAVSGTVLVRATGGELRLPSDARLRVERWDCVSGEFIAVLLERSKRCPLSLSDLVKIMEVTYFVVISTDF